MELCSERLRLLICGTWLSLAFTSASAQIKHVPIGAPPHNYVLPAVTGRPYTLTETRTSVKKQAVGDPQTTIFVSHKMRDSQGRVRTELGHVVDGTFKSISIHVTDPVGHFSATLFPNQKLAMVTHYLAPEVLSPAEQAKADAATAKREEMRRSAKNPNEEDLPAETIAGITVPGKRLHLVIQGAAVTEDRWYSPELKIELKEETEDPRVGHFSVIVSDLQRTEPAAALFQIPADYRVESHDSIDVGPAIVARI